MTRRELLAALLGIPALQSATASPDDIVSFTVQQIADHVRRRSLSPLEITDAYLWRIARLNPELRAYVTFTADRAREDARRLTDRLTRNTILRAPYAAPIAHKDLFETAGILTTAGSKLFEHYIPRSSATVVSRLVTAGTVLLGKTNTHELGGGVTTINPFFGTTRNPADLTRIAGGSSGGSAAAVAARLAAAATGSDTGGSVRIPAALCGVVGFKPTFGRVHTGGLLGSCPTFDHVGFITRTVEDAEIMFNAAATNAALTAGLNTGVKTSLKAGPSRIGIPRRFFFDNLEPDVGKAMDGAIARFTSIGASVRDRDLPVDDKTMARVFDPIIVSEIWKRFGDDWRRRPDSFSLNFASFFVSTPPSAPELFAAQLARRAFQADVEKAFAGIDVFIMPTVPITAPRIDGKIEGMKILRNTWPFNAARTPAISVPCGVDRNGLPIGLQLVAKVGDDQRLLETARAFEESR